MTLRFGIVGCGMIADFHARAIAETRGARLVACASRTVLTAREFAGRHGIEHALTPDALCGSDSVDAIAVCTPSGAHLEPALAAIRSGKHVVVEKPLEVTLPRCDRMIKAAAKHGVVLATIFPSRYLPDAERLKTAIDESRFGSIVLADAYVKWYRDQAYYSSSEWKGTWALDGGGALMNQAIHAVDLLRWMMGPVESVSAHAATRGHDGIEVEDVVVATLQFASGALGTVEATTAAYPGEPRRIEIAGTQGSAVLANDRLTQWEFARPARGDAAVRRAIHAEARGSGKGGAANPAAIGHRGHARQYQDFVRSIQRAESPRVAGSEGRLAVELVRAIYDAARSGKRIRLS